jgi:hypothetical protein
MRALVYHGPGKRAWEEVPDPEITDEGDVIVRVDATTICGEGRYGQYTEGGGWVLKVVLTREEDDEED